MPLSPALAVPPARPPESPGLPARAPAGLPASLAEPPSSPSRPAWSPLLSVFALAPPAVAPDFGACEVHPTQMSQPHVSNDQRTSVPVRVHRIETCMLCSNSSGVYQKPTAGPP